MLSIGADLMRSVLFLFPFALFISTFSAYANDLEQERQLVLEEYQHDGLLYPPVFFVTNIEDDSFEEKLDAMASFKAIDKKSVGLPIGLRILKGHRTKQDGTQFTSLMLSASTLGIIPLVSNTQFKVRYDVFVQGKSIANYEYTMDSTDVDNMWTSAYKDFEIKPTESLFLHDSLSKFMRELAENEEVQAVFAEYREYFSEE
jgi:hypothetical protein